MQEKPPIVLVAYNRPHYFEKVLQSLVGQTQDRSTFCVIDGPRNSSDAELANHCVDLCLKYLPKCSIHKQEQNQGVARIMKIARNLGFSRGEFAIIIEDDSLLQPHYIQQLDILINLFKDDERVCMLNCFGEHHRSQSSHKYSYIDYENQAFKKSSLDQQERNKDKLVLMDHLWAYAIRKSSYKKIEDIIEAYLSLIPNDYRQRPHFNIESLMASFGVDPRKIVSSQDSCTSAAFAARGMIKIATFTNNFEYIGEIGEHSRPRDFAIEGWRDQDVNNKLQETFLVNEDVISEISEHMQKKYLL